MTDLYEQKHQSNSLITGQESLSLNDRLGLIALIDEGMKMGSTDSPIVADLFNNLWGLVNATVSGSKINRQRPEDGQNGFHVFEINAESGENIGRLNMLYLKKPIPCYYLVYVEVTAPFRRKGLGTRIVKDFGEFLIKKSAVGILDNIIPEDDPTYDIYYKNAWEPIEDIIGDSMVNEQRNYMVFIPPAFQGKDLKEPFIKLLYHLKRKRAAIDMRDNETMVRRTIAEFKDLYQSLLTYFHIEIEKGESPPIMRLMFTRFVTKLIAFRRRIGTLIGYTGGESMGQISLGPEISNMKAKSYAPKELAKGASLVVGDLTLLARLPLELQKEPAQFIETLPNYRRPSFIAWLNEKGKTYEDMLTLGDLFDLGFDPTRLKEITIDGKPFIFERMQARQLTELGKKNELLQRIASEMQGEKVRNAWLKVNPMLLAIRDRGNAYVLRRKIEGIHWEEALEQLQSHPSLKAMNASTSVDRLLLATVRDAMERIANKIEVDKGAILDQMTAFVSWNIEFNQPRVVIEFGSTYLESFWIA